MKTELIQEPNIEIDRLKWLYYQYKDSLLKETDIINENITKDFYDTIEGKIRKGETNNIAVKGEVSGSKSTSAIAIMDFGNKILEEINKSKIDRFSHILADQTEFIRFISTEERNAFIVIDEFSSVAETGFNATTETALYDHYSNVFAQKFIHRISCSPATVLDKNANIILEYIGKDEKAMISRFVVRYRNPAEGFRTVPLGHIDIDVSVILKKDFYTRYRTKKFKRMELIDKHGVRDIRELEFAGIIIESIKDLKDMVINCNRGEVSDLIKPVLKRICREQKRIYSMLTVNEIESEIRSILGLYWLLSKEEIKKSKAKTETEVYYCNKKIKKTTEELNNALEEQVKKLNIYKEYLNIT